MSRRVQLVLTLGLLAAGRLAAQGTTATITITGTVEEGLDVTGVFGPPNSSLAGQPFTVVYTFDSTLGTPTEQCLSDGLIPIYCNAGLEGSDSASPGGATVSIGQSAPVAVDQIGQGYSSVGTMAFMGGMEVGWGTMSVQIEMIITPAITQTGPVPDFDWRNSFVVPFGGNSIQAGTAFGSLSISNGIGTQLASAVLTPTAVSVSGVACQNPSSLAINIDNSSVGQQPNILGGNVGSFNSATGAYYGNYMTNVTVSAPGTDLLTWASASFGNDDLAKHEILPLGAILDAVGGATVPYGTMYTTSPFYGTAVSGAYNDQLYAQVCSSVSPALNIYEYYPYINSSAGVHFDIGQSQVTDSIFVQTNSLTETQIQAFFEHYGTFLANFYFDNVTSNGGWYNPDGKGKPTDIFNADTDEPYCPTPSNCPEGTQEGTSAAVVLLNAAMSGGVNPELLLTKLQVEPGLIIKATTLPSVATLNAALGCNGKKNQTFYAQLFCAAKTYMDLLNKGKMQTFPYFFPQEGEDAMDNVQYAYSARDIPGERCNEHMLMDGCAFVGYYVADASTYAELKYTPFVQTSTSGGGVRLFETLWLQFSQIWNVQ